MQRFRGLLSASCGVSITEADGAAADGAAAHEKADKGPMTSWAMSCRKWDD